MLLLPDKSIKLIYGSPPYPNAERQYGVWRSSEYIKMMTPFLNAACAKLCDDGFIVINVKANREKSTAKLVDPWMGSGTTGYAALSLGRRFVGFDIVEGYVSEANIWLRSIAGGNDDDKEQET